MFLASKLLSALTQPLAWAVALLLLALWWLPRRPVAARRALQAGVSGVLLVGWLPLPDALLRSLENRHPVPEWVAAGRLQPYVGVVVLGGGLEPAYVWLGRGQVALNAAAERLTVPVALLRQHPHLKLLFTGGEGGLWSEGASEAAQAKAFFAGMGVLPGALLVEDRSRTTYENATLGAAVRGVDKAQPWLLVTSAWHMPRALGTFRAAGWNVTPFPVDYRTGSATPWTEYSLARGAMRWQLALHEWAGWCAYRLAGRA